MAKEHYKVPSSLSRSFLDHEITLSAGGMRLPAVSFKQLLFWLGSFLALLWAMTSTFLGDAGFLLGTVTVLWWAAATVFFGRRTKTQELRARTVMAFLAYLPRSARHVMTRRGSDPSEFYSIAGINSVDDDGKISFADGTFGRLYLVVGSASALLFDEDRVAILNRVDAFWRKVEPTAEHLVFTTKEPQRIYRQIAALERRNRALAYRDPDLIELMDEQHDILTQYVGGQFSSLHQYLLLKGDTEDALRRAHINLQAEVEASSLMIKSPCTMLERAETLAMLRVFYTGVDADEMHRLSPAQAVAAA